MALSRLGEAALAADRCASTKRRHGNFLGPVGGPDATSEWELAIVAWLAACVVHAAHGGEYRAAARCSCGCTREPSAATPLATLERLWKNKKCKTPADEEFEDNDDEEKEEDSDLKPFSPSYTFLCMPKKSIPLTKWKKLFAILEPKRMNGLKTVKLNSVIHFAMLGYIAGGVPPNTRRLECGITCFKNMLDMYVNEYEERGFPLRQIELNLVKIRSLALEQGWKDRWFYGKGAMEPT